MIERSTMPAHRRSVLAWSLSAALVAGCATAGPSPAPSSRADASPAPVVSAASPSPSSSSPPSSSPTPSATPGLVSLTDVPFTPPVACASNPKWTDAICQLQFDIAAPPPRGGPHPLIVLLRGGPDRPHAIDYLRDAAQRLAERGAVAMVADWRESPDYAGGPPVSFQDVACAIGVARKIGPSYGADPSRVTIVGHSLGAWPASVATFSTRPYTPPEGQCNETAGSLQADALVDLDGAVDASSGRVPRRARAPVPILIAHAEADGTVSVEVSRAFARALRKAGFDPRLIITPGGDHISVLYDASVLDGIATLAGGG